MVKEDGLPLGLGFGLAMNEDAMRGCSSLDDEENCGNWKNKING